MGKWYEAPPGMVFMPESTDAELKALKAKARRLQREVRELQEQLDKAPHAEECRLSAYIVVPASAKCDCWKSKLAGAT